MNQKGVSLIIAFLVMTVVLAIILAMVVLLFPQVKLISNTGDSISAFYAADTGVEKTLYLNKTSPQTGTSPAAGLCGICNTCATTTADCQNCAIALVGAGDCSTTCSSCKVSYTSTFDGRTVEVEATITPGSPNVFYIKSTGTYNGIKRVHTYNSSKQ